VVEGRASEPGRRLLVLGAGPAQLGFLEAARERGLYVIAVDRDPAAPGFRYADRRALISTEDEPAIQRLAEAEAPDGVIAPGTDWPVGIAARVAQRLALPHALDPDTAALTLSKVRQRERFLAAGVPHVPWRLANGDGKVPLPCVVKAPDRQGQRGMTIVREPSALAQAIHLAMTESRTGTALIEELVDGPEVTVNAFSVDGRFHAVAVTDRLTADPPAFGVALAHVWPAEHGAGAAEVAERAAAALGIENGPTYTQLRIGADGPQVVELAARLGGGHDAELCRAAVGVDLNGLALDAALGDRREVPEAEAAVGGACTRFLVAPEGLLRGTTGAEDAEQVDGVVCVRVYRQPGHVFGALRRGADRAGAVIAMGESREQALERAGAAAARIRFDTVDAPLETSNTA
jgi:biotin carboxylase